MFDGKNLVAMQASSRSKYVTHQMNQISTINVQCQQQDNDNPTAMAISLTSSTSSQEFPPSYVDRLRSEATKAVAHLSQMTMAALKATEKLFPYICSQIENTKSPFSFVFSIIISWCTAHRAVLGSPARTI